jgi:hypothetical protein
VVEEEVLEQLEDVVEAEEKVAEVEAEEKEAEVEPEDHKRKKKMDPPGFPAQSWED